MNSNNKLANVTSPYLRQHADNPVDWWPWNDEALAQARQNDKPILLSIGYSACHWCHVMAHESFEDQATAELMNSLFVNIKVDREERPDLDKIYQTVYQLMNQRGGGWPLTVFLAPDDHTPLYAGTYFPDKPRHGMPAFKDVLQGVANAWATRRPELRKQSESIQQALSRLSTPASTGEDLNTEPVQQALQNLRASFDPNTGGFGDAPKFPHPEMLNHLLIQAQADDSGKAVQMLETTLNHMALGGVNDQLAGGFCRYSTDDKWMIPHFEKMLYDNGPLLGVYADAYLLTGNPLYRQTMQATADWIINSMQSRSGGYYSSIDADSEGVEGLFYVWQPEQIKSLLNETEYTLVARRFGLEQSANFEGDWHLHCDASTQPLVLDDTQMTVWDSARTKLLAERNQRVAPGIDDKVLTSWNALAIKGLVKAYKVSADEAYLQSAETAVAFIRNTLCQNGRLLAVYKDGVAHLNAYLDDYAYLIDALLELLSVRWKNEDLSFALSLADVLLAHYQDRESGGFYFTSDEHESLIQRPKSYADDAMPCGNGIAAKCLNRLGHLLADTRYIDAAEATLKNGWHQLKDLPHAHCSMLDALDEFVDTPEIVIMRGEDDALRQWQAQVNKGLKPNRWVLAIASNAEQLPASLADKKAPEEQGDNVVVAYVCKGMTCAPPITDIALL